MYQEQTISKECAESCLEEMRKIISSESFAKTPRLSSFLRYVVEKSISEELHDLTEQQIGIHVFNRAPGYNSNDDNIVRGTARHLRQRLEVYYESEGRQDPIRIEIPKGAYVAHFEEIAEMIGEPVQETIASQPAVNFSADKQPSAAWVHRVIWLAVVFIFATLLFGLWRPVRARFFSPEDKSALLWKTLFTSDRTTFLVPGDAGLNMYEVLDSTNVDLETYTQQSYINRTDAAHPKDIGEVLGLRAYTTMSDLQLVSQLVRLPEVKPEHFQVRMARDLTANDITDANLILLGTQSYNPWTTLYELSLSLQMSWDMKQDLFSVTNRSPQAGELPFYQWTPRTGTRGGLTLIALTNNSQGSGHVLLVQGTTMMGVYAGSDFLFNRQLLDPILARAEKPDGSLRNFEVLLQSDFIRAGVSNLHVLAVHVHY